MARISKEQYKEIISNFPWANLNKEITGTVLRQFINNIIDSVAEMTLLDESTIEEAIQELRNRPVGGGGEGSQFSQQFKTINQVVWLNLKYITANHEEFEPEPSGADIVLANDGAGLLTNIIDFNPATDLDIAYNSETGVYTITPTRILLSHPEDPGQIALASPIMFDLEKLNNANLQYQTGDWLYLQFDFWAVNVWSTQGSDLVAIMGSLLRQGYSAPLYGYKLWSEMNAEAWHTITVRIGYYPVVGAFMGVMALEQVELLTTMNWRIRNIQLYRDIT